MVLRPTRTGVVAPRGVTATAARRSRSALCPSRCTWVEQTAGSLGSGGLRGGSTLGEPSEDGLGSPLESPGRPRRLCGCQRGEPSSSLPAVGAGVGGRGGDGVDGASASGGLGGCGYQACSGRLGGAGGFALRQGR